ncbi:hypothetical protein ACFPLB_07010 [Aquamicrobium segne]|uniref:Fibronectin attachment protein n=1 Tax=Aquamicrobium segne TaxID=469547 RepID=A0ABW0GVL6_9HYPH
MFAGLGLMSQPAAALSEIQRQDLPPPLAPAAAPDDFSPGAVPLPDPIQTSQPPSRDTASPEDEQPEKQLDPRDTPKHPLTDTMDELPEVIYDLDRLPEPVRRMHGLILQASKSGDINQLRPLVGTGDSATQLSLIEIDGDPVDFLKSLSGDTEGQEILAIMEEVLSAGFVHLDAGAPEELYVWPYFFGLPLDRLSAPQRVELFKIVTAGDLEDMQQFGAYIFYRLGITPEGHWAFFVAGD